MDGQADYAASSSSRGAGESVITDYGRRKTTCGYCKSGDKTSIAHGLWAHSMRVDDYQELLDCGWRRSGSYVYKPDMERTCCPSYTIRLKVDDFVPSKEQVRVCRRMQRFLDGAFCLKKTDLRKDEPIISRTVSVGSSSRSPNGRTSDTLEKETFTSSSGFSLVWDQYETNVSSKIDNAVSACIQYGVLPSGVDIPQATVKKVVPQMKKKLQEIGKDLLYTSSIAFQIVAAMKRSISVEKEISPTYIAGKLAESMGQQGKLSGLSVLACNGHLNFYSQREESASQETPSDNSVQSFKGNAANAKQKCLLNEKELSQRKRQRLEIRTKRSSFDPEEYDLYRRYQTKVHNDKPDHLEESAYKRFLVDTPLIFVPPSGDGSTPPCGFGSFHQQYLIDGKLVAVGVVDVLPRCLSSKYLFWDPDFASLSLGKYSALQEINWVKEAELFCPNMQFYYLGYYIHTCVKMRYKASYSPSELLCPLRYQWVPFHIVKPLLDKKPYVILSDFIGTKSLSILPCHNEEDTSRQQCLSSVDEDEAIYDGGEESEAEFCSSDSGPDDEPDLETESLLDENGAISEVKIGVSNTRLQFKDLVKALGQNKRQLVDSLERQLNRYMRAVGPSLSKSMIYLLD